MGDKARMGGQHIANEEGDEWAQKPRGDGQSASTGTQCVGCVKQPFCLHSCCKQEVCKRGQQQSDTLCTSLIDISLILVL